MSSHDDFATTIPQNNGYVAYVNPLREESLLLFHATMMMMCKEKVDILAEQVRIRFSFTIPHSRRQRLVARTVDLVARCTTDEEARGAADEELDSVFAWYQRQYEESVVSRP